MSNKIQNLENEYHNYLNSLKLDNSSFYKEDYKKSINSANKHVNEAGSPDEVAILIYKIIN